MKAPLTLNSFLGNARVVDILRRAVQRDRLPHAMIFSGPQGVGKCTLAVLLAQYLNCQSPAKESGCGRCAICRRIAAVIETRYLECTSPRGELPCGSCANCAKMAPRHPDVRIIEISSGRTRIRIDQIRSMIAEIAYQPFEARYRVVILDPAEQLSQQAQNSLLKTLEEPPSRTIIILVTTNPYLLLDTTRSRSRQLQFGGISQRQIEEYLLNKGGRLSEEAHLAAILSGGSLEAALSFNTAEYKEVRSQTLGFVTLCLTKGSFTAASTIAASLKGMKKEDLRIWIDSMGAILQDVYCAQVAPDRICQLDLKDELTRLARAARRDVVLSALRWLTELKAALRNNVFPQLALEAMFLGLSAGQNPPYGFR